MVSGLDALGAGGNAILNALTTGGNVLFEQSFLQGVSQLFAEEGLTAGLLNRPAARLLVCADGAFPDCPDGRSLRQDEL